VGDTEYFKNLPWLEKKKTSDRLEKKEKEKGEEERR